MTCLVFTVSLKHKAFDICVWFEAGRKVGEISDWKLLDFKYSELSLVSLIHLKTRIHNINTDDIFERSWIFQTQIIK